MTRWEELDRVKSDLEKEEPSTFGSIFGDNNGNSVETDECFGDEA